MTQIHRIVFYCQFNKSDPLWFQQYATATNNCKQQRTLIGPILNIQFESDFDSAVRIV